MAKSTIYAGLEIGTSKICVVIGEAKRDGTIKILGVGTAPSRGVRKGEIIDFANGTIPDRGRVVGVVSSVLEGLDLQGREFVLGAKKD